MVVGVPLGGAVLGTRTRATVGIGALHCASRLAAAGEFRSRADFARSQIDMGGPGGAVLGTLPSATDGCGFFVRCGTSQISPSESTNWPPRPWIPTATVPLGQRCQPYRCLPVSFVCPGPIGGVGHCP